MSLYSNLLHNYDQKISKLENQISEKNRIIEKLERKIKNLTTVEISGNVPETVMKTENQNDENQALIKENAELKKELENLKRKKSCEKINNDKNKNCIVLTLPCEEKNLFENEIEDFLYKLLYDALELQNHHFPQNKNDEHFRKQDVITSLLKTKTFDFEKSFTSNLMRNIKEVLETGEKSKLESYGFIKKGACKGYQKYYFHKERYQFMFSRTPEDRNAPKNQMREISKRVFLYKM